MSARPERRRRRGERVALLAALAAAATTLAPRPSSAQTTPAPRPRVPYVVAACPFECCTYGAWRFVTGAAVRAAPRESSPVVARIAAGERVRADSGHVRLDTLGLVLVRRDVREPDTGEGYRAGDTLLVLDYLGEGFSHVWVRGERRQLSLLDAVPLHGAMASPDTAAMAELRSPAATWWVHVTLPARPPAGKAAGTRPRARRGWVRMTNDLEVRGADACGGPG